MRKSYRRKQYFIDKKFQTKFIVKFCTIIILSSLLIGALTFLFSQNSTTVAIENTQVTVKRTADFILPMLTSIAVIVAIFSALIVLAISLLASHKISGPLYRLQREIASIEKLDLRRNFSIRANDQLQALAKSLNGMCNSLRSKQLEANTKLTKLKDYLASKDSPATSAQKDKIISLLTELEDTLKAFKV